MPDHLRLRRRCERTGHDWFPAQPAPREFLPWPQTCLRCGTDRAVAPYGECLTGHPIADHYDERGRPTYLTTCPEGPR